jgi:hypothetical protein
MNHKGHEAPLNGRGTKSTKNIFIPFTVYELFYVRIIQSREPFGLAFSKELSTINK